MPVESRLDLTRLTRALRFLSQAQVLVGVPSDDEQPHEGIGPLGPNKRNDSPLNNATIGFIHENGAPEINLPARPHLKPGVASAREDIARRLRDAGEAAMKGDLSLAERNLHAAGLTAQSAVRNYIAAGVPPPLKPATVRARRQRTQGSSYRRKATGPGDVTPLINSGAYISSISYVISQRR